MIQVVYWKSGGELVLSTSRPFQGVHVGHSDVAEFEILSGFIPDIPDTKKSLRKPE
jgi:hypothetical protein